MIEKLVIREPWLELGFVRKTLLSEIKGEFRDLSTDWPSDDCPSDDRPSVTVRSELLLTCIFSLFRSLLFFAASFLFCCLAIFSSILKAFFCWRLVIWASILLLTDYNWIFIFKKVTNFFSVLYKVVFHTGFQ